MKMHRAVAFILSLLLIVLPVTPVLADTLSISAWSTGESLSSNNLNSRMTSITTWSTKIANDNISSTAAIVGSKLDLTSGTGRISHSTSVTSDAPVFTSGQTWNNIANVFSAWRLTVTNTNSASSSRLIDLRVGSTIIASLSRVGQLMLTPQDYASGPTTLMEGAYFNIASGTYTDNITAASGTAPRFMAYAFQRPALAAANSSVTTTHAATVFIASAPVAGDNMTLTNRYALWVDQGDVRLGGAVFASGAATIDGRLETRGALWAQGATSLDGAATLNGAVTLGNAAADNITVTGTLTSNLIFTDNTYDIGASGATRPRHAYLSGNLLASGTATIDGTVSLNGTVNLGNALADITHVKGSLQASGSAFIDGNVGVRTTAPGALLQVGGVGNNGIVRLWGTQHTGDGSNIIFNHAVGGGQQDSHVAKILSASSDVSPNNSLQFFVGNWNNNANVGTAAMSIVSSGNVGILTATPGGGTTAGTAVLSLANGTAPVGGVANQVSLFSKDVTNSAELFALDEAGNTPQLSPHPASRLNLTPVKALGPYAYPWVYTSANAYLGKRISVDMAGLVEAVEALTGKSFTTLEELPPTERADWDAGQQAQTDVRNTQISAAVARKADLQAKADSEPDAVKKTELQRQADAVSIPPAYVKKAPPQWMKARGVVSAIP